MGQTINYNTIDMEKWYKHINRKWEKHMVLYKQAADRWHAIAMVQKQRNQYKL